MIKRKKILLVEDDVNLGSILKDFLGLKEYEVILCSDGEEGLKEFYNSRFDICILDVMMPKLDGFTMAKEIRGKDSKTPIVFLTAKSMLEDKLEGLKLGADDYMTKPFSSEELLLRINAILKRSSANSYNGNSFSNEFEIGSYNFDYNKRLLTRNGNDQKLTSKESELLKLLCLSKNEVMNRSEALKSIWNEDSYFTGRSMDVYIAKLRNYLKEDPCIEIINVHGAGFKLIENC
ncbi:MAG: response regulator transcription factor [Melioribacteraceae bacterium]|nr:response regulator transcription factor [Melioribacteraceae bacterium]